MNKFQQTPILIIKMFRFLPQERQTKIIGYLRWGVTFFCQKVL